MRDLQQLFSKQRETDPGPSPHMVHMFVFKLENKLKTPPEIGSLHVNIICYQLKMFHFLSLL